MLVQASTSAALAVEQLSKSYGDRRAVDGLSFALPAGCWVALLGPNGAGKSTLFQLLTGLFRADAGEVVVDGVSMNAAPARALAKIGVVFQQMSLDLDLSVEQNLRFHAALHGLGRQRTRERIDAGCAAMGLTADRPRRVRELSGGTRRKVELVRSLLHEPRVLLMDEPTVGLDPQSRRDLLAAIRADVDRRGSTVLWATHLVEEAQGADRVMVMHRGRLLHEGTPAAVREAMGAATLEAGFIAATAALAAAKPALPAAA